jgi:hypothetical protein
MNSDKKTTRSLEDLKINVKIKLSLLWVALVFFYLYNDVISFFRRDTIEMVLSGEVPGGIQITQTFLFGMAILMAIPIFMTFLSLALKAKANRRVNIILGIFHAVVFITVLVLVPGEVHAHYALYMILEAVFIALIVWTAWKWPTLENQLK